MANSNLNKDSLEIRLGSDLKFPISGSFEPISGLDLVLQDMQQLLLTLPGERVNRPNYGCALRNQIWENIDVVATEGPNSIKTALELFEPRIQVLGVGVVEVNENTGLIAFNIEFKVKETDQNVSLVFPFRTGTQLSLA